MKNLRFALVLVFAAIFAVGTEANAQSVLDGVYIKENTPNRRYIKYTHLREADVMWALRIWRTVDLREKINHVLYYPIEPIANRQSLFDVMRTSMLNGNLIAYGNPLLDDEFKVELTKSEIEAMFVLYDTLYTEDLETGELVQTPVKEDFKSAEVKQFWVKEDWFFDKQKSVLEARILGLCPLKENKGDDGEVRGYEPMFWIYFPEARPIFANSECFNRHNDAERRTLEDIFWKRQFGSFIHKRSNVYDRTIREYKQGLDALLRSDEIKDYMFRFEHDLWHF